MYTVCQIHVLERVREAICMQGVVSVISTNALFLCALSMDTCTGSVHVAWIRAHPWDRILVRYLSTRDAVTHARLRGRQSHGLTGVDRYGLVAFDVRGAICSH